MPFKLLVLSFHKNIQPSVQKNFICQDSSSFQFRMQNYLAFQSTGFPFGKGNPIRFSFSGRFRHTYTKQESTNKTSIKKTKLLIDNLSSCFQCTCKQYGTPGHQKMHFVVCFVSINPQMQNQLIKVTLTKWMKPIFKCCSNDCNKKLYLWV